MPQAVPVQNDLVLVMENGTSASGRTLTKKLTYKNLKLTASDSDIYAVAQGIVALQEKNNLAVYRVSTVEITE